MRRIKSAPANICMMEHKKKNNIEMIESEHKVCFLTRETEQIQRIKKKAAYINKKNKNVLKENIDQEIVSTIFDIFLICVWYQITFRNIYKYWILYQLDYCFIVNRK